MATPRSSSSKEGHVCDTLPAPAVRFVEAASDATSAATTNSADDQQPKRPADFRPQPNLRSATASPESDAHNMADSTATPPAVPPPRKLCVRHQRMADEGTNLKLQQVRNRPLVLIIICC